jgi:cytochrome P450
MSVTSAPPAGAGSVPVALDVLPHAGIIDVVTGLQAYFRPGAGRSRLRRLGDRCVVDVPGFPTLVLTCSPDDAKVVLADRDGELSLGGALRRLTPHPVLFGEDSLIFLEGEEHTRERRRKSPPFHGRTMTAYEPDLVELASRLVEAWPVDERVAFRGLAQQFVLQVMRTVIFGVSEDDRTRRLDDAVIAYCQQVESDAFLAAGTLGVVLSRRWRRYPPLDRAAAAVDAILLEEIAQRRRAAENRGDFLSLLLEANDGDEQSRDDATLARDMRGLMLAGYETTAVTLASTIDLVVHHPEALATLHETIDAGDDTYLDAVITEAMRMRPAFPFTGRRVLRDFDMNGVRVPKGAMIVISIMALHERLELYDAPETFRPERFLNERPGTYTWLTFGGGRHRCLGASLALFESRVLLRTLLQRRTITAAEQRLRPPRRTHPMLVPAANAAVRIEHRNTAQRGRAGR